MKVKGQVVSRKNIRAGRFVARWAAKDGAGLAEGPGRDSMIAAARAVISSPRELDRIGAEMRTVRQEEWCGTVVAQAIMGSQESIARKLERESGSWDGKYARPWGCHLRALGGVCLESSNDGAGNGSWSHSPTEVWEFPDGSKLEVAFSDCAAF